MRRLHHVAYLGAGALPLALRRRLFFLFFHRRWPNLRHPRTMSEKINWRILHDRSQRLAWTCDKLAMKDHVAVLAPDILIPRTIWSGSDVRELLEADLPLTWVLKANHRSGIYRIIDGAIDLRGLRRSTAGWLGAKQGRLLGEWAYQEARPLIFAEERIGGEGTLIDYKFFVFRGAVKYVEVHHGRRSEYRTRYYTAQWRPLDVRNGPPLAPVEPPPPHLEEMVRFAGQIGEPFDFMRVDLYDTAEGVYFGETSPYPSSGLEPYDPVGFDLELGARWASFDLEK